MSRNKSVFRQPGAQHFQVLHRSLRDPLANDESASSHVLSEIPKRGTAAQKSQAAVEEEVEHGIHYEDDYDYLQHMRTIGTEREAVFVPSNTQQKRQKSQLQGQDGIALPAEALPSQGEERDYAEMLGIPDRPWGLQPEMDPGLREVLEALEDEAYVGPTDQQEHDEDFFESLMGDEGGSDFDEETQVDTRTGWEKHMDQFKAAPPLDACSDDDEDFGSEAGDTVADLQQSMSKRKPRGAAASTIPDSAFSMSSSAMFRNEGLRTLDDRFDKLEAEYEDEELSDEDTEDDEPVDLGEKRPDLSGILDDFLSKYQQLGPTPINHANPQKYAKLEEMRQALRNLDLNDEDANKRYILERAAQLDRLEEQGKHEKSAGVAIDQLGPQKDRWDCQTVLSTRSNLENHPKMIRLRDISGKKGQAKGMAGQEEQPRRIVLDPKTGFPSLQPDLAQAPTDEEEAPDASSSQEDETQQGPTPGVLARHRSETKEDKKARKQAVKNERATRRVEKKANKDLFNAETARQKGLAARSNKADKQIGQKGVVGLS